MVKNLLGRHSESCQNHNNGITHHHVFRRMDSGRSLYRHDIHANLVTYVNTEGVNITLEAGSNLGHFMQANGTAPIPTGNARPPQNPHFVYRNSHFPPMQVPLGMPQTMPPINPVIPRPLYHPQALLNIPANLRNRRPYAIQTPQPVPQPFNSYPQNVTTGVMPPSSIRSPMNQFFHGPRPQLPPSHHYPLHILQNMPSPPYPSRMDIPITFAHTAPMQHDEPEDSEIPHPTNSEADTTDANEGNESGQNVYVGEENNYETERNGYEGEQNDYAGHQNRFGAEQNDYGTEENDYENGEDMESETKPDSTVFDEEGDLEMPQERNEEFFEERQEHGDEEGFPTRARVDVEVKGTVDIENYQSMSINFYRHVVKIPLERLHSDQRSQKIRLPIFRNITQEASTSTADDNRESQKEDLKATPRGKRSGNKQVYDKACNTDEDLDMCKPSTSGLNKNHVDNRLENKFVYIGNPDIIVLDDDDSD